MEGKDFLERYTGIEHETTILLNPVAHVFNSETLCRMYGDDFGNSRIAEYDFTDGTGIIVGYTESLEVSRAYVAVIRMLSKLYQENTLICPDIIAGPNSSFMFVTAGGFRIPENQAAEQIIMGRAFPLLLLARNGPKSEIARITLDRMCKHWKDINVALSGINIDTHQIPSIPRGEGQLRFANLYRADR